MAAAKVDALQKIKKQDLTIYAPRDGVIGQGPKPDDIGKYITVDREGPQPGQEQAPPLFTIIEPGQLRVWLPARRLR